MSPFRISAATLLLAILGNFATATEDWPEWLGPLTHQPTPEYAVKAPALVLLDETVMEIDSRGVATETRRYAVRILHSSGRDYAAAWTFYNGSSGKVTSTDAWLWRNGKAGHDIERKDWVDIAANSPGAAIDELRSRGINLSAFAIDGDVFAAELKVREPLIVAQLGPFYFGQKLPVVTERLQLVVPPGFKIESQLFGAAPPLAGKPDSRTWTWTSSDRPYRPDETLATMGSRFDGELMIGLHAPGEAGFSPRSFASWSAVTEMYDQLNAGQCDSSAELAAKARELTANCADATAKIKAIGAYVQRVRYIEINQGLQHGFGWKPRKASSVFSAGYGDCKDKANLLKAMLHEVGINSHMVIAFADPDQSRVVHPEFPSPIQFNHAILGIEVDDAVQLPSVVVTEKWGRMLFFDPTNPYTAVGDLPFYLQGTIVHIAAPGNNTLTRLPNLSAKDDFHLERRAALSLSGGSDVTVKGDFTAVGQVASDFRERVEAADGAEKLQRLVTGELSDAFRGATVQAQATSDDRSADRSALSFTCFHPRFAQQLQGRGTMVKLDVLSRHYLPNFSETTRSLPAELPSLMLHDEITLSLDGGYSVEDLPPRTAFDGPYGSYEISFTLVPGALVMNRTVLLNKQEVAPADYVRLRKFFSDIARADRTSILLRHGA